MSTANRVELSCGHVYFMLVQDFLLSLPFPLLSQLNGKLLNQYAKQQAACGKEAGGEIPLATATAG